MLYESKKFFRKSYPTPGLILSHFMRNPLKITLSEPKCFTQKASANCFRHSKFLAHALARNTWAFFDKGAYAFRKIVLWRSSRPWLAFEYDFPIGETLAPFLQRRKTEGFMVIDSLQFRPNAIPG
jgi:hypothetical protein